MSYNNNRVKIGSWIIIQWILVIPASVMLITRFQNYFLPFFRFQIARFREGPKVKKKVVLEKKDIFFNRLNIRITIILQLIFLYTFSALIINYRANWIIVCCQKLYIYILFYIKKPMIATLIKIRKETWIIIFRYIELPGVLQLYRHESFTGEFLRLSRECTWPRRRCTHAAWGVSIFSY